MHSEIATSTYLGVALSIAEERAADLATAGGNEEDGRLVHEAVFGGEKVGHLGVDLLPEAEPRHLAAEGVVRPVAGQRACSALRCQPAHREGYAVY